MLCCDLIHNAFTLLQADAHPEKEEKKKNVNKIIPKACGLNAKGRRAEVRKVKKNEEKTNKICVRRLKVYDSMRLCMYFYFIFKKYSHNKRHSEESVLLCSYFIYVYINLLC